MGLKYDILTVETEYDDKLTVLDLELDEKLNEHGVLHVVFRAKEADAKEIFDRVSNESKIRVMEEKNCLFAGYLSDIQMKKDKGETRLFTTWKSASSYLDIKKRERAITGSDFTYEKLVEKITASYGKIYEDTLSEGKLIPGFLLQYKETDWEFLKRIAGLAGGVLTPDNTNFKGKFIFGLPKGEAVDIDAEHEEVTTYVDYDRYGRRAFVAPLTTFLQDFYHKEFKAEKTYSLGQKIKLDDFEGVIERIQIPSGTSHVEKVYTAVSEYGVAMHTGINEAYSGLHFAATVSDVKETTIKVNFDIETITSGSEIYFPYAVESSAWYAMPEKGSSVHIYLPEKNETLAYAVHSLRNTEDGATHASATSDPSSKSYTHPSGSAMTLTGSALTLTSDTDGNATATMGSDGTLGLKAKKITITALGNINIGEKGGAVTPAIDVNSATEMTLASGGGAYAYLGEQLFLSGSKVTLDAEIHDAVEIPDAILNRNEGIEDEINAVNAAAKEIEKQKLQEAKKKTGLGLFAMAIGAVAIAAVCVCTCGAGLVVVAAVAGTAAIACGAASVAEGVSDYKKAAESGDFSQSYNFMRDGVFGGNQTLYDCVLYGSVLICGIVIGVATGGGGLEALKEVLLSTGKDMLMDLGGNLIMDYLDDGCINNGLESYLKSMAMSGAISGCSSGIDNYIDFLKDAKGLPCNKASWVRFGLDSTLDVFSDFAQNGDVNLTQILVSNYLSDKVIGGDPIDLATGSLYIPATDMVIWEPEEDFKVTRKYESINKRVGLLGYGWTSNIENCMHITPNKCRVLMHDGHVETFDLLDGEWSNDKGDSKAVTLEETPEGYRLHDWFEKKTYCFNENGKQTAIVDRHGNTSRFVYKGNDLAEIHTFTNKVIQVEIQDGKFHKLEDELGRTVVYEYDGDFLVSVNQFGRGITRYSYDKKGHVIDITDQNNKQYTKNTFDDKGRIIKQVFADGTGCDITYDDVNRTATFSYPATGKIEKSYFNQRKLVTKLEYQDGTTIEYKYDQWLNRIYEKNRRGAETKRLYSEQGKLLREELPNGLITDYSYDEVGNLTQKTDNSGACTKYTYDINGNLVEESVLCDAKLQQYKTRRMEYQANGTLLWEEDFCQNRTTYVYDVDEYRPSMCISPEGYEFRYTYDENGRRISVETENGVTSYSYNGLNYVNKVVNPLGNVQREERDNLGNLIRKFSGRQAEGSTSDVGYSYKYDHFDKLIWMRDPLGREKIYERDGQGNVIFESLLSKNPTEGVRSTYDANDNRLSAVYPDGGVWNTRYDSEDNLLFEDKPALSESGRYYTYDSMDHVIKITDTKGQMLHEYKYDLRGNLVWECDALKQDKYYAYDEANRKIAFWELVEKDCYRVIRYEYDDCDHVIAEKKGLQGVAALSYPEDYLTITKGYDKEGRLISVADGSGAVMEYTYDQMNNRTGETALLDEKGHKKQFAYKYDKSGRLIRKEQTIGKQVAVTSFEYDAADNITGIILPEKEQIRFVYDEADRIVCRFDKDEKHGIRRAMLYEYPDVCPISKEELYGKKTSIREINQLLIDSQTSEITSGELVNTIYKEVPSTIRHFAGKTAQRIYHEAEKAYEDINQFDENRYSRIAIGAEKTDYYQRSYTTDFRGNVTYRTDTLGNEWKYIYNVSGRLTSVINPLKETDYYGYDAQGRILNHINGAGEKVYALTYDALNRVTEETDALGQVVHYGYDILGNQNVITDTDGNVARELQRNLWGYTIRVIDGMGNVTTYDRDRWGKVRKVIYPDGGVEQVFYNYAGNITKAIDANGNVSNFAYNENEQISTISKREGLYRRFEYDLDGRCNRRIDENGAEIISLYNMDGNVVYRKGSVGENQIISSYEYTEEGVLSKASENGFAYQYVYDTEGRMTDKKVAGGMSLHHTYDALGRIVELKNGSDITTYDYDASGNLSEVALSTGLKVSYTYDAAGNQKEITYNNGLRTRYLFDSHFNMVSLETINTKTNQVYLRSSFTYDGNDNRITKKEQLLGQNIDVRYGYDALNRLTEEESDNYCRVYEYDLAGNRISLQKVDGDVQVKESYDYNQRNQLVGVTAVIGQNQLVYQVKYSYDLTGNLVQESSENRTRTYGYDAYNRCATIAENEQLIQENRYDAEGYRVHLSTKKEETSFMYHYGMLQSEEGQEEQVSYTLGNGYLSLNDGESSYLTITDEQLSVRLLLGPEGNVHKLYQYDAFGNEIQGSQEECEKYADTRDSRLRYNSQIYDAETEDYYLRFRYYRPQIGRFLQEDVIYVDGFNLYTYCGSNPVIYCDPSGFEKVPCKPEGEAGSEGGKTTEPFDIVNYGDKTPGLENHHGVLDVWATNNIDGYVSRASNSTTIALTKEQHAATKSVYRDWLFEKTGKKVGGKVDWKSVSPQEVQSLSERMFDAAGVPNYARRNYYSEFNKYIYGLGD